MDIRQMVRKALLKEDKKSTYDYGCVMVYLKVSPEDWNTIQDLINEDDLYKGTEEDGDKFGREKTPHITLLYGIHSDVPDKDVEKIIDDIKKPSLELDKVSTFDNEKFDVLKFDIENTYLNELNKEFKILPHTSDHAIYHAHCTISYIKKGKADKYVKLLNDKKSISVEPEKIVYSKPNGVKKQYDLK